MRTRWRAVLAGLVVAAGIAGTAAPALAGPCYYVTVYDSSGNPKTVQVCPYD